MQNINNYIGLFSPFYNPYNYQNNLDVDYFSIKAWQMT